MCLCHGFRFNKSQQMVIEGRFIFDWNVIQDLNISPFFISEQQYLFCINLNLLQRIEYKAIKRFPPYMLLDLTFPLFKN